MRWAFARSLPAAVDMVLRVSRSCLSVPVARAIRFNTFCFPSSLKALAHLVRGLRACAFSVRSGGFVWPFRRIWRLAAIVCSFRRNLSLIYVFETSGEENCPGYWFCSMVALAEVTAQHEFCTIFTVCSAENLFGRLSIQCCERVVKIKRAKFP
jgi:hypothetical protein